MNTISVADLDGGNVQMLYQALQDSVGKFTERKVKLL